MLDDYELLYLANEGNEDATNELINKYYGLICYKATKYSPSKLDIEDFINEGLLCLHEAIYNYLDTKNTKFNKYLNTCLERKMINLKKMFTRKKFCILNNSFSIDENCIEINEHLIDNKQNPDNILIDREEYEILRKKILKQLNNKEELVFILREQNFSAKEIANIIDKNLVEIYNTIKSIRIKTIKTM